MLPNFLGCPRDNGFIDQQGYISTTPMYEEYGLDLAQCAARCFERTECNTFLHNSVETPNECKLFSEKVPTESNKDSWRFCSKIGKIEGDKCTLVMISIKIIGHRTWVISFL